MKLTLVFILYAILTLVSSVGLNEEFSWTKITYRWPRPGPSKRQVHTESRNRGRERYTFSTENQDVIIFDGETNAVTAEKSKEESIPKFIDYIHGELPNVRAFIFLLSIKKFRAKLSKKMLGLLIVYKKVFVIIVKL